MPQLRQRYAVFGRLAYALPDLRASIARHGPPLRRQLGGAGRHRRRDVNKYLGQALLLSFRGHYHLQSGASFYRGSNAYRLPGPDGQYWTGDRELSPMSNYLVGGKLAFMRRPGQEHSSWFVEMEFDAKYEILFYQVQPDAPNADRKFAHILQGAISARF